jgi:hypothetical protein
MSYWLYGKNSEGKKTITSSNLFGWSGDNSWLSTICLAVATSFLLDLLLLFFVGRILPDMPAILGIPLFFFVAIGVFIFFFWLFRPKKKLPNPKKADEGKSVSR